MQACWLGDGVRGELWPHVARPWAPHRAGCCFPAGHVSSAFALVGGAFALRTVSMRASRLWTAWICWSLSVPLWHSAVVAPLRLIRRRAS